jgi:hypothetical protein
MRNFAKMHVGNKLFKLARKLVAQNLYFKSGTAHATQGLNKVSICVIAQNAQKHPTIHRLLAHSQEKYFNSVISYIQLHESMDGTKHDCQIFRTERAKKTIIFV